MSNPYPLRPNYSKWANFETKAIRVPKVFVPEVLEFARKLDGTVAPQTTRTLKIKDFVEIVTVLQESLSLPADEGEAIKAEVKKALKILETRSD